MCGFRVAGRKRRKRGPSEIMEFLKIIEMTSRMLPFDDCRSFNPVRLVLAQLLSCHAPQTLEIIQTAIPNSKFEPHFSKAVTSKEMRA